MKLTSVQWVNLFHTLTGESFKNYDGWRHTSDEFSFDETLISRLDFVTKLRRSTTSIRHPNNFYGKYLFNNSSEYHPIRAAFEEICELEFESLEDFKEALLAKGLDLDPGEETLPSVSPNPILFAAPSISNMELPKSVEDIIVAILLHEIVVLNKLFFSPKAFNTCFKGWDDMLKFTNLLSLNDLKITLEKPFALALLSFDTHGNDYENFCDNLNYEHSKIFNKVINREQKYGRAYVSLNAISCKL